VPALVEILKTEEKRKRKDVPVPVPVRVPDPKIGHGTES